MLLRNSRYLTVGTSIGGANVLSNKFKIKEEEWFGVTRISEYASYPQGYGSKSFAMPLRAGAMSVRIDAKLNLSASLGTAVKSSTTISSTSILEASGGLIVLGGVTLNAASSMTASMSGKINGSVSFLATSSFNITTNYMRATCEMSCGLDAITTMNATISAKANMSSSSADNSVLSPASIWAYSNRTLTSSSGSGGLTEDQATQLTNIEALASLIPATL